MSSIISVLETNLFCIFCYHPEDKFILVAVTFFLYQVFSLLFSEFMNSVNGQAYLYFWLAVEVYSSAIVCIY